MWFSHLAKEYLEPVPKPAISRWHRFGVGIDQRHHPVFCRVNHGVAGIQLLSMVSTIHYRHVARRNMSGEISISMM